MNTPWRILAPSSVSTKLRQDQGPLVSNLIAVLERRLVEMSIRSLEDKPLAGATLARLDDIAAFLSGDFDDARCAALLAGLVWARPARFGSKQIRAGSSLLPFAYAALKPVLTPDATLQSAGVLPRTSRMPAPPGLIAHLRAGGAGRDGRTTDAAVRLAMTRARASGLATPFKAPPAGSRASMIESGRVGAGIPANRLAAVLLIPIGDLALTALIKRAYPGTLTDNDNPTTEDITYAT